MHNSALLRKLKREISREFVFCVEMQQRRCVAQTWPGCAASLFRPQQYRKPAVIGAWTPRQFWSLPSKASTMPAFHRC